MHQKEWKDPEIARGGERDGEEGEGEQEKARDGFLRGRPAVDNEALGVWEEEVRSCLRRFFGVCERLQDMMRVSRSG